MLRLYVKYTYTTQYNKCEEKYYGEYGFLYTRKITIL